MTLPSACRFFDRAGWPPRETGRLMVDEPSRLAFINHDVRESPVCKWPHRCLALEVCEGLTDLLHPAKGAGDVEIGCDVQRQLLQGASRHERGDQVARVAVHEELGDVGQPCGRGR
jgi:hypothetical protein